jgi:hypothetical protein
MHAIFSFPNIVYKHPLALIYHLFHRTILYNTLQKRGYIVRPYKGWTEALTDLQVYHLKTEL